MFVNTLTADGKYPVQYCENLQLLTQMQFSEKRKNFCEFFVPFLESPSNFKHFEKKMMVVTNIFPNWYTVKILVRLLSQKRCFRKCFDSQHLKPSPILAKSLWECFYEFFSSIWGKSIWKISPLVLGDI